MVPVDADTVVKNDQLIRDEVLTYSRGYMERWKVIKRWEEGGQHHATILRCKRWGASSPKSCGERRLL